MGNMKNSQNMNKLIDKLKEYFRSKKDVEMAFIFGSIVKGTVSEGSDIDIGIYLKPKTGRIEVEETKAKYDIDKMWLELERITGYNVDLVVLNRAPATVADCALRGKPILIRDRGLYLDFMLRVTAIAEDFRDWVEDYWRLKNRLARGI